MKKKKSAAAAEAYTLDTSAFLALWNDEEGADAVEDVLKRASRGEAKVYYSFMTAMELYYGVKRKRGKEEADELYSALGYLPAESVESGERLLLTAAEIKSENQLSVADAWIAATAEITGSILVHKDPEFEALRKRIALNMIV